uniref:E3 ubiquitin-protein ligase n=1 Tax=Macrostomum lignano TaxID=282301 RepID=A0A1I8FU21_9PLAT
YTPPAACHHSSCLRQGLQQQRHSSTTAAAALLLLLFKFLLFLSPPRRARLGSGSERRPRQRLSTDGVMRRSRHQLSSSLRAPWPGSLTPSLAARLCLLACAFVATAAAAASASKAAANSDAFLAAVLSLGPAPGQRPIINRAKRRSPPSPVELAPQLIDSLGLCPGDSDSVALAARLEALSAAWLRVRHCPHLPLATVLPMFPGQPGAEPLPGSAGNAFDTTKKFEFDAGVPPSGCSALLLGPAEATRALPAWPAQLVLRLLLLLPLLLPRLLLVAAASAPGRVADRSDQLRAVSNHFGGLLNQMYFKAKSAHSQEHIESLKQCQSKRAVGPPSQREMDNDW